MNITDGFFVSEKITHETRGSIPLLVSCQVPGDFSNVHVDALDIDLSENHKFLLKFPVRPGLVHGTVYMFRHTDSRGPVFFHESVKGALSAAHDSECVCSRLRVSSGMGSISMSMTIYKYLFPIGTSESPSLQYGNVYVHEPLPVTGDSNGVIEKFERCVAALRKVECDPVAFAEDVSYLASILRVPDHISRQYSRDMVESMKMSGGDIHRIMDIYSRTTRISTLLSMLDT